MTLSALGIGVMRPSTIPVDDGISFNFLSRRFVAKPVGGSPINYATAESAMSFTTPAKWVLNQSGILAQIPANQPAYEYQSTGAPLGILIENAKTNVCLRSNAIDQSPWGVWQCQAFGSGSVVDADVAPDGTTTAERVTENTANDGHSAFQFVSLTATRWTASIFAKRPAANARNWLNIFTNAPGGTFLANFDLLNGVVGTVSGTGAAARITDFGNGWWRCELAFTPTGSASAAIEFALATANTATVYTGNGASGLLLWGGQIEVGDRASSYIPTAGSAVARAADTISYTAPSGTFDTAVGTALAEIRSRIFPPGFGDILRISDARTLYHFQAAGSGTGDGTNIVDAGYATMVNAVSSHGSQWGGAAGNLRASARFTGSVVSAATSFDGAMGAGSTLSIGGSSDRLDGHMRRLVVWPRRLSDSDIGALLA